MKVTINVIIGHSTTASPEKVDHIHVNTCINHVNFFINCINNFDYQTNRWITGFAKFRRFCWLLGLTSHFNFWNHFKKKITILEFTKKTSLLHTGPSSQLLTKSIFAKILISLPDTNMDIWSKYPLQPLENISSCLNVYLMYWKYIYPFFS